MGAGSLAFIVAFRSKRKWGFVVRSQMYGTEKKPVCIWGSRMDRSGREVTVPQASWKGTVSGLWRVNWWELDYEGGFRILDGKKEAKPLRLHQSYFFLIHHQPLNMSLSILLLCRLNNGGCMNAASCGLENCVAPEVSVQAQGKESYAWYCILRNRGIWWRNRSCCSHGPRHLHAVERCVWPQTGISDSGLFLGKPGIQTALNTIHLPYGMGGENNSKILSIHQGAISTHTLIQPFCVFLDKLLFNKSFISQEVLFYMLL